MLQLNFIRENKDLVIKKLKVKNFKDAETSIDNVLTLDNQRREIQTHLDEIKSQQNIIAKEVGKLFKEGKKDEESKRKMLQ